MDSSSFWLFQYGHLLKDPKDNDVKTGPFKIASLSQIPQSILKQMLKDYEECYAFLFHYPSLALLIQQNIDKGSEITRKDLTSLTPHDNDLVKNAIELQKIVKEILSSDSVEITPLRSVMAEHGRFSYYPASALLQASQLLEKIEEFFSEALLILRPLQGKTLPEIVESTSTILSNIPQILNLKTNQDVDFKSFKSAYVEYLEAQLNLVQQERTCLHKAMLARLKWISEKKMINAETSEFPDDLIPARIYRLQGKSIPDLKFYPKINLTMFSSLHMEVAKSSIQNPFQDLFWCNDSLNATFRVNVVAKKALLTLVPAKRGRLISVCEKNSLPYTGPSIEDWALYQFLKQKLDEELTHPVEKIFLVKLLDRMCSLLLGWQITSKNHNEFERAWGEQLGAIAKELLDSVQNDELFDSTSLNDPTNGFLFSLLPNFKKLIFLMRHSVLLGRLKASESEYLEGAPQVLIRSNSSQCLAIFEQGLFLSSLDRESKFKIWVEFLKTSKANSFKDLEESLKSLWLFDSQNILQKVFETFVGTADVLSQDLIKLLEGDFRDELIQHWISRKTPQLKSCLSKIKDAFSSESKGVIEKDDVLEAFNTLKVCEPYQKSYIQDLIDHLMDYVKDSSHLSLLLTTIILRLNKHELTERYGRLYFDSFVQKKLVGMTKDDNFYQLCASVPALMKSVSESLNQSTKESLDNLAFISLFGTWRFLERFLVSERQSSTTMIEKVFFIELERISRIEDFRQAFQLLMSFEWDFSGEFLRKLKETLLIIIKQKWCVQGSEIVEGMSAHVPLEKLQSYRLKWLQALMTSQVTEIPLKAYQLGFNGLCEYFGPLNVSEVLQSLSRIPSASIISSDAYNLIEGYFHRSNAPKDINMLSLYQEFTSVVGKLSGVFKNFTLIEAIMEALNRDDDQQVHAIIDQLTSELPPAQQEKISPQQIHLKKILKEIFSRIEEWMVEMIFKGNFAFQAFEFPDETKSFQTERFLFLHKNTRLILSFYTRIYELKDALSSLAYVPLKPFWYGFLIHPQLFILLSSLNLEAKNVLNNALNQVVLNCQDSKLKEALWSIRQFLKGEISQVSQPESIQRSLFQFFITELSNQLVDIENEDKWKEDKINIAEVVLFTMDPFLDKSQEPVASSSNAVMPLPLLNIRLQKAIPELSLLDDFRQVLVMPNTTLSNVRKSLNLTVPIKSSRFVASKSQSWQLALNNILKENELEGSVKIESGSRGKCFLHPHVKKILFTDVFFNVDNILDHNQKTTNKHIVFKVEMNGRFLYFKLFPDAIGLQMMSIAWQRLLFDTGFDIELLKFPASLGNQKMDYPVQVSSEVPGETVAELWNQQKIFSIDSKNFSQNFLRLLFENEQDGKPENYIAQGEGTIRTLRPIDSEQGFGPATNSVKNWLGQLSIDLCVISVIFCFDEMLQPLHPEIVAQFLTLDPRKVLVQLIKEAEHQQDVHRKLFDAQERKNLYKEKQLFLDHVFTERMIKDWFVNFCRLQEILRQQPQMTALSLLQAIHPEAASFYEPLFLHPTPQQRFAVISDQTNRHKVIETTQSTKKQYITSRTNPQVLRSILGAPSSSERAIQEKTLHPKIALNYLNQLIVQFDHLEKIQRELIAGNCNLFTELSDQYFKRAVINGIEGRWSGIQFETLTPMQQSTILGVMKGIAWTTLNLKGCKTTLTLELLTDLIQSSPDLETLDISDCRLLETKSLTKLLNQCTKLKVLVLNDLNIWAPQLVLGIPRRRILALPELRYLSIQNNDVLTSLKLTTPKLKKLEISGCPHLESLFVWCPTYTQISISKMSQTFFVVTPANFPKAQAIISFLSKDVSTIDEVTGFLWGEDYVDVILFSLRYLDKSYIDTTFVQSLISNKMYRNFQENKLQKCGVFVFFGDHAYLVLKGNHYSTTTSDSVSPASGSS